MSEKRSSEDRVEGAPASKRRSVGSETGGGSESTSRRRVALLAEAPVVERRALVVDVKAGPPSLGEEDSSAPLPKGLKFAWGSFGRKRVTVDELKALKDPRPDVKRLLSVAQAVDDGAERISAWVGRQTVYVVPAGLPCSVTFVRALDEVKYIDACARLLFVEKSIGEYETPLVVIGSFKRFPFAYHRDAATVKRWKAAAGVRRTLNALADERDWALVCQRGAEPSVFNHWAEFIEGITSADFAKVPKALERFDVSAGVVVPVPWLSRFFGTIFDVSDDEWLYKSVERWIESEWAFLVMEAYAYECYEKGNAWIIDQALIDLCEKKAKDFDDLPAGVGALSVDKLRWKAVVRAMGDAAEQAGVARSWSDYCTNRSYRYVGFDARTGSVYGKATSDVGGRAAPGPSVGDGRSGVRRSSAPAVGEFGTSVLYRVVSEGEAKMIVGLDEALGGTIAKRAEHQRRVGDLLTDLAGQARSQRQQVSALSDTVASLQQDVAEREAKVKRLEAELDAERKNRRSEAVVRPDPYRAEAYRSDAYRQDPYRADPYRSDPYEHFVSEQRYPDPYAGGYRQAVYPRTARGSDEAGAATYRRRQPSVAGGSGIDIGDEPAQPSPEGRAAGFGTGFDGGPPTSRGA